MFAESGGTTRMDALRSTFEPSRDDFKLVGFVIRSTEETRDDCGTIPWEKSGFFLTGGERGGVKSSHFPSFSNTKT